MPLEEEDDETPKPPPQSKLIFMNNVDSYQGENIAKVSIVILVYTSSDRAVGLK